MESSIKGLCVNGRQLREGWRHLSVIISITLSPLHILIRIRVYLTNGTLYRGFTITKSPFRANDLYYTSIDVSTITLS